MAVTRRRTAWIAAQTERCAQDRAEEMRVDDVDRKLLQE